VFYPLFNESPWLYRPYEMTIIVPFNGHIVDGGKKWDEWKISNYTAGFL
jgi:hypothetical protein